MVKQGFVLGVCAALLVMLTVCAEAKGSVSFSQGRGSSVSGTFSSSSVSTSSKEFDISSGVTVFPDKPINENEVGNLVQIESDEPSAFNQVKEIARACIRSHCYESVVARTKEDLIKGLKGYTSLTPFEGMVFVFDEPGPHGFWMMDMRISIDIIWLDARYRVLHVASNVLPCLNKLKCPVYKPEHSASYVLEVKAGEADKRRIKVGDRFMIFWEEKQ